MSNSKRIAGILGPGMAVAVAAEFPLLQPGLYTHQIPPVIYLSGLLMFIAGLAIVRSHNLWTRDWRILVTASGWALLALGLVRTFGATAYQQAIGSPDSAAFMVTEAVLFVLGLYLTFKAYTAPH